MFGGIHDLNIDSKGRLAVPAKFRDLLLRRYTPALVATLENRERLLLYPESVWEQEAARLMAVNAAGNPVRFPMYVSLLTNVLNALFSGLGIYVFQLGIVGVALGTVLARLVGVLILWRELDWSTISWSWSLNRKQIGRAHV